MKDSRLYVALMARFHLSGLIFSQRSPQVRMRLEVLGVYVGLAGLVSRMQIRFLSHPRWQGSKTSKFSERAGS